MQETFLQAFAAEARNNIRAPKAYLLRVAKNLALNEISRMSRLTTNYLEDCEDQSVLKDDGLVSAEARLADKQALSALTQAISALPKQWRDVFVLRKMEQLSYREISERLDVPVSTAEKYVATSLLRCEDILRRQGHDPDEIRATLAMRRPKKKQAKVAQLRGARPSGRERDDDQ